MKKGVLVILAIVTTLILCVCIMFFYRNQLTPTISDDTIITDENIYEVAEFLGLDASAIGKKDETIEPVTMTVGELREAIVPSMVTACGKDKIESTGEYLSKTYNLESDKVTIYLLGDPEELVITDPEDIKALQDSVDFKSWQYVSPGSGYDGIEVYFVQFNKQTTIAMYLKDAYGLLGKGSPDVNGALQSTDAYYNMSESLLQTAKQMVEKYTK